MEDILDENKMADGHDYFDFGDYEISPDNGLCAYSVDTVSRRQYVVRFRDLSTGEDLSDVITSTSGSGAWADNKTFFYSRKDKTLRSYKIFRHTLGTDEKSDVEVFHEKDGAFSCDVYRDRSDKFVVIVTGSTLSTEECSCRRRTRELRHLPEARGRTRIQRAACPRKILHPHQLERQELPVDGMSDERPASMWTEVMPHRDDVLLEDVDLFKDHMVFSERKLGLVHLRVRKLSTGAEHQIVFNDPAYVAYSGTNPEYDSDVTLRLHQPHHPEQRVRAQPEHERTIVEAAGSTGGLQC